MCAILSRLPGLPSGVADTLQQILVDRPTQAVHHEHEHRGDSCDASNYIIQDALNGDRRHGAIRWLSATRRNQPPEALVLVLTSFAHARKKSHVRASKLSGLLTTEQ